MVQSDTVLERDSLADKMNDKQSKQTMLRIVLAERAMRRSTGTIPSAPLVELSMELEDEYSWLRHRVIRLRTILRYVTDPKAETGLRELIAEAEQRLEQLEVRAKPSS
jgi:hypothetical protein